ncbi:MAG: Gfo/Idh/MocA family oxidoreductase [Candidatus Omnitrophica bacterium]|nr:Gfo/Idh/MocA family oxidoreductase [Candidatus Omnitrophota bacterium]
MSRKKAINFGVIGYGYWGPNIVRNLQVIEGANLVSLCDKNMSVFHRLRRTDNHLEFFKDYREITSSTNIDAVAIATPASTHFEIVKSALLNGKHVFIEKPIASSSKEAEKLVELADKRNLKIMVDHTFLFTGAVKKIKELVDKNALGELFYYDSTRVNLGLFQHDINVIWDLLPHDFAIMNYVIKNKPVAISAQGIDHFGRGKENIAYVTIHFADNFIAHFNVNWLSPVKIRLTLIGGSKNMLVWNDMDADEKIKIYDKGVKIKEKEGVYKLLVDYRSGNMWSPKLDRAEALKTELEYFIRYIKSNFAAINDGHAGLRIVKMLEASDKSLKGSGKPVKI